MKTQVNINFHIHINLTYRMQIKLWSDGLPTSKLTKGGLYKGCETRAIVKAPDIQFVHIVQITLALNQKEKNALIY